MKKYFYLCLILVFFNLVSSCYWLSGLTPLRPSYYRNIVSLDWSPDGKQMAFVYQNQKEGKDNYSGDPVVGRVNNIYTIDIDGSNLKKNSTIGETSSSATEILQWAPDGQYFFLTGSYSFYKIKADGSDEYEKIDKLPEILTTTEQKTRKVINKIINEIDSKCKTYGILTNPRWLNNKELLTFKLKEYPSYPHECDLSKLYIYKYTINIDTLEVEKEELISTLKNSGIFSPDGTQITIIGSEDNRIEGIYIMNIDGSNKRKLVDVTQLPKGDPDYLW